MTDSSGSQTGDTVNYLPFGETRAGNVPTDKLFTGQRLDSTGLYYYGARYYNPIIGRFLSPDGVSPDLNNPQSFNKYAYCFNNPLKYNDPTGHWPSWSNIWGGVKSAAQATVNFVKENVDSIQTGLDVLGMIPVVGEAFDAVNGAIYAARGDALNAGLSFAACIPVVGTAATGIKLGAKAIDKGLDVIKAVDKVGDTFSVYRSVNKSTGIVDYIGMTKNFDQRAAQQSVVGREIEEITGLTGLSKSDARGVEQVLINKYGLSQYGGTLTNKINSIAETNPIYDIATERGMDLLRFYGYY
jgi:RHS repeat-associated protein